MNSPSNIYIERRGKLVKTDVTFKDNEHLMRVIEKNRFLGRTANRRGLSDGRCSFEGWFARERNHSSALAGWPGVVD